MSVWYHQYVGVHKRKKQYHNIKRVGNVTEDIEF